MAPEHGAATPARWRRALAEHRAALNRYVEEIEGLDDARWVRPRAAGHWSPALITQHLILYYEAFARALRGEIELRHRLGPVWRAVLRWFLVPHILFHRTLPLKAAAPREVRPAGEPLPRAEAVRNLVGAVGVAEEELRKVMNRRRLRINHPYFGGLPPLRFLRISAVHLDHHRRQVASTPRDD